MLDLVAQSILSGIGVGCIYGLIGIGFCVIYNASGIVNFAQGAFVMMGGMVTYTAFARYGLPLPLAAALAIVLVAFAGVVLERLVVRPLWNRGSTMFVMILATLAAQIVIERQAISRARCRCSPTGRRCASSALPSISSSSGSLPVRCW